MGNKFMSTYDKNEMYKRAWNYFEFHGNQRIMLFKYFVVFLTLYLTGIGYLVPKFAYPGINDELFTVLTSISFLILTLVFQTIDKRSIQLMCLAKNALKAIEKTNDVNVPADVKVFTNEEKNTCCVIRHTFCFNVIFYLSYLLSILFLVGSFFSMAYYSKSANENSICIKMEETREKICWKN